MASLVTCSACGEVAEASTCPSCGAKLLADPLDRITPRTDQDQTLSDQDQIVSDQDQTWADHDQTASDSDQRSSDEDQQAADEDFSAGGSAVAHRRSAAARGRTSHDRAAVSELRDAGAGARMENAKERDRTASLRDRAVDDRDDLIILDDPNEVAEDILTRAKQDRARAAADRAKAATDRERAEIDRAQAARDRAVALENRTESAQNLKQSTTDGLTGVWTRKFGLEELSRELERAHRTGDKLVLAFVDVDGLKEVNDSQGHLAGDALLKLVGETLLLNVRPYDVVLRYGGDEFVCGMPNLSERQANSRFEKIAAQLSTVNPRHSITFGLAEAEPSDSVQDLIARADAALLEARL
jgi:diguanylate cyclase (GGDEF)-like protein